MGKSPWEQDYFDIYRMSFKKMHRRAYVFWVAASILVMVSMVAFLFAPFFMY